MNSRRLLILAAALLFSVPAAKADDKSMRIEGKAQLYALVESAMRFAQNHPERRYPESLQELAKAEKLDPSALTSALGSIEGSSYEFLLPGKKISSITEPHRTPLLRTRATLPSGERMVAFVDGHIEFLPLEKK